MNTQLKDILSASYNRGEISSIDVVDILCAEGGYTQDQAADVADELRLPGIIQRDKEWTPFVSDVAARFATIKPLSQ